MNMKQDDCYLTNTGTIIRFSETPADIDVHFPNAIQGSKKSISRAILNACLEEDRFYTLHRLKETLLKDVQVDISTDENGLRTVQFSKNGLLEGFSLGSHDDIDKDALLRLFGDGLVRQLEKEYQNVPIESIVPSSIVKDGDAYIGIYISPVYLNERMELNDAGKELYHTIPEYLHRFESFVKNPVEYSYTEYDDEKKINEKSGLLGPEMPVKDVPELGRFLGSFTDIKDAVGAISDGAMLDMELSRIQEKADEQTGKKEQEKELQRGV